MPQYMGNADFALYVPREVGHVRVRVHFRNDRPDVTTNKEHYFPVMVTLLSQWKNLPDNADIHLSMSDVLLFLLEMYGTC